VQEPEPPPPPDTSGRPLTLAQREKLQLDAIKFLEYLSLHHNGKEEARVLEEKENQPRLILPNDVDWTSLEIDKQRLALTYLADLASYGPSEQEINLRR